MKKTKTQNQIEYLEVSKLVPYARNAKKHDDSQVASIAGSIKEFGFNNPVLIDKDNCIIAGHGRVLAAQKLELKEVPCLRLSHLSENQKRAYILADNRLAELGGGWDEDMLKLELDDIDFADFSNFELGDLGNIGDIDNLNSGGAEKKDNEHGEKKPNNEKMYCPQCGFEYGILKNNKKGNA
jgi:hypothetical protein